MLARLGLFAIAASTACVYSLDHQPPDATDLNARLCEVSENVQSCLDAAQHSDFTYVQAQILVPKCAIQGSCHDGGTGYPAGRLNFTTLADAYTSLVNAPSKLDTTRILVVPGDPAKSFLTVMIGQIKPSEADPPLAAIPIGTDGKFVGTMPQDSATVLCCQKLDAIARWIGSGAPME